MNKWVKRLKSKLRLGYNTKNFIYLLKLSFYPKIAIVCCLLATIILNIILACCMFMVEAESNAYNVLFALVTGVTASCFISIVIELSNNFKNNKLACYELDGYYRLILDFECSKYSAIKLMSDDREYQVRDIVQLVWQKLPVMMTLLLSTLEHKKAFLTDNEIVVLTSIKSEYDGIRAEVCSKIRYSLLYNAVNHPDECCLRKQYPENILSDLPLWVKKYLATKESEQSIEDFTDIVMTDEFLLKQYMVEYNISIQSITAYSDEYKKNNNVLKMEVENAYNAFDYEYEDMTEEEHKKFCDDINKMLWQENIPFVSWYISNSCYQIAKHIEELKEYVLNKPYVGIYLEFISVTNKVTSNRFRK